MKLDDFKKLETVVDARFRAEQHRLATLLAEERAIEASLNTLSAIEQPSAVEEERLAIMHISGAALAWSAWSAKQKLQLNAKLSNLRARKTQETERLRTAFGQREAIRLILEVSPRDPKKR